MQKHCLHKISPGPLTSLYLWTLSSSHFRHPHGGCGKDPFASTSYLGSSRARKRDTQCQKSREEIATFYHKGNLKAGRVHSSSSSSPSPQRKEGSKRISSMKRGLKRKHPSGSNLNDRKEGESIWFCVCVSDDYQYLLLKTLVVLELQKKNPSERMKSLQYMIVRIDQRGIFPRFSAAERAVFVPRVLWEATKCRVGWTCGLQTVPRIHWKIIPPYQLLLMRFYRLCENYGFCLHKCTMF